MSVAAELGSPTGAQMITSSGSSSSLPPGPVGTTTAALALAVGPVALVADERLDRVVQGIVLANSNPGAASRRSGPEPNAAPASGVKAARPANETSRAEFA